MEKLKKFIDKCKILHIVIIVLIINISYIIIIKNPKEKELYQLYEAVKNQRLELINSENAVKQLNNRLEKIKNTNESLKKFYTTVLKNRTEGIVGLRKELAELLRQINIYKIDINYTNTPIEKHNLHEVSLNLPVEGSYSNIRKFINSIENSQNFMVIKGVSLTESKQQLKLELSISVYFKDYGRI